MPDKQTPIPSYQRVEGIDTARVVVVQPCTEHPQPAQFPAVLMRKNIIGVVGASPVVAVSAHWSSFDELAGNGAIPLILSLKGLNENFIDIFDCHRAFLAGEV